MMRDGVPCKPCGRHNQSVNQFAFHCRKRLSGRSFAILVMALLLAGMLRALALWAHAPLYAYANSYDQTRYTSCFDLYPQRSGVAPQQNSPATPYARYVFIETGVPMCYWSSEFAFQALTVAIYRIEAAITSAKEHSVRWIGALRLAALLALSVGLSRAWWRRGERRAALANTALLLLVFADPGNTLYLNTFYAEWTTLLAAYATLALIALWRGYDRSWGRFAALALVAFVLATSKLQHLALPLVFAAVLAVPGWLLDRRIGWRAIALLVGGVSGLALQTVQLQRGGAMMDAIRQYNAADVVFTALVPLAGDPRALLVEMGIDPDCVEYAGDKAWQLPGMPDNVCPSLATFGRGTELVALLHHQRIAARLAWHGMLDLDPWLAQNIGHIEGSEFAHIPRSTPSVGVLLHAYPAVQFGLLALPLAGLIGLMAGGGLRRSRNIRNSIGNPFFDAPAKNLPPRKREVVQCLSTHPEVAGSHPLTVPQSWNGAFEFTALIVSLMLTTFAITLLGDGLADVAKQGHLVVNAALAWLVILAIGSISASRGTTA